MSGSKSALKCNLGPVSNTCIWTISHLFAVKNNFRRRGQFWTNSTKQPVPECRSELKQYKHTHTQLSKH